VRQVVFITDGAVGGEGTLFRAIQQDLGRSRLYPVGIGSAPNAHFMTRAARFGRGQFTYIGRPDEVTEKMTALFDQIDRPVLHDLALDWGEVAVEVWPRRLPDLYAGQPLVVAARLPADARRVVLTGRREGESIRLEFPLTGGQDHEGVARLWARRKVASLMDSLHEGASIDGVSAEVASLGVHHQLVTRWSSLVAVDVTPTAPVDAEPETRAVPTKLPRGWKAKGVFGRPDGGAPKDPASDQRLAAAAPSVDQPLPTVQIGRLPQGGSPAALLMIGGGLLLAGTCLTYGCGWARTRRALRDGAESS
jgi:Ca-activated chloride channel family protein